MYKIIIILSVFFVFLSCKKKDKDPDPITNSPTPTPPADGSLSNATSFFGIFTAGNYTSVIAGGSSFSSTSARAYFSNQAVPGVYNASSVKISKVDLNGDTLSYNDTYKYYLSTYSVNLTNETWSVSGANGIGSFSFTNVALQPDCSGLNNLPDSISKSTGFSVSFNNIINITSASFLVFDGSGNVNGYYSAPLVAGNNTITISSANLASLSTSTNGLLAVTLYNKKAVVFSSKDYQFSRESQYSKHIKIKN